MSNLVIRVENLSKRYKIGVAKYRHDTLRDQITYGLRTLFSRDGLGVTPSAQRSAPSDFIWALKDVSFEVKRGEVIGFIGRNGAGKSTLLKILSRITEPSAGFAEIQGRVASLLEVGTGFQGELTGRENIYLNGAILGMKKAEIDRKFDEIVAFSEVEKFIDTPVKRYSSGMFVRLAFAVAAHLEPEILIVDEVLAVGDASFQKKCLGKMDDIARGGRTVLFVSHNMGSVGQLCGRVLWVDQGQVKLSGHPAKVIAEYLSSSGTTSSIWTNSSASVNNKRFYVRSVRVLAEDNSPSAVVPFDRLFRIEVTYVIINPIRDLSITYQLKDLQGNVVWGSWDTDTTGLKHSVREPGHYKSICKIPGGLLKPGRYVLSVASHNNREVIARHAEVLAFDVSELGYDLNLNRAGVITPVLEWEVIRVDATGSAAH